MTGQSASGLFALLCFRVLSLVCVCLSFSIPAGPVSEVRALVVAIGDVHGDFDDFSLILKRVGLIGEGNHWSGGHATLVQTGDLVDRGPKEREVLELMISLEKEAPGAGGRVVALLGNHEMMNLMGDLRYVTPEIYASFATALSDQLRKSAYQEYLQWRKDNSRILAKTHDPLLELSEPDWFARHPLGFIEQRRAFSRDGVYGKWIRKRSAVEKTNGSIFLHGGIAPALSHLKLEEINSRIHGEMDQWDDLVQYLTSEKLILPFFTLPETTAVVKTVLTASARKPHAPSTEMQVPRLAPFLQVGSWLAVSTDGPLWFRGYDEWTDEEGAERIEKLLAAYEASAFIVGHTVQQGGNIRARFQNRVFLIDTGMTGSRSHSGRASALEISDTEKFTSVYLDSQVVPFERGAAGPH